MSTTVPTPGVLSLGATTSTMTRLGQHHGSTDASGALTEAWTQVDHDALVTGPVRLYGASAARFNAAMQSPRVTATEPPLPIDAD